MSADGAVAGREIEFVWNGAPVLGVREKGMSLNGTPIDVTSDDDDGWSTLLDVSGEDKVDLTLSGVTKDERLKIDWFARTRMRTCTITWPNGSSMTGLFYLASLDLKGPYKDAETFDAKIQSSGVITFTPYA